jgi:hypothetical protein
MGLRGGMPELYKIYKSAEFTIGALALEKYLSYCQIFMFGVVPCLIPTYVEDTFFHGVYTRTTSHTPLVGYARQLPTMEISSMSGKKWKQKMVAMQHSIPQDVVDKTAQDHRMVTGPKRVLKKI